MASHYDCVVIGGGIAGLQGAIQLGRYKHRTLVVDKGYGRSTLCRSYHNVLGWPDGVSGEELRRLGKLQAERLGVQFIKGAVARLNRQEDVFSVEISGESQAIKADTLLLATGLLDRFPKLPGLINCLGSSVYVCPDCDGYETQGHRTIVMGSGDVGASMALHLLYWTSDLIYINHEAAIAPVSKAMMEKLIDKGIVYYGQTIDEVITSGDGIFHGVRMIDGQEINGARGFIAFGGNEVQSELASQLRIERLENKHIVTDPRTKMTSVPGVWAAGDVGVHAEQLTIAMGEGAQAAIWIHKELLKRSSKPALIR
ncbi:NAD(P)/FAD-dependent oxidoreductase [Paenibacillus radicis (ex Xue et al. 2023)]|uniref:NAD(P)/FAD-dependent oxidoreductase n=1 Tax=Paenibacillus radicis (ex Xue et al. 2023) TaxID=2972489 RepID=A0ABT1YKX5_9BACL|nr:NAD(P)/FAD-dependent oxidoreductase [Paenibacillus radicis (ex Xue et al. 2023)]MCR8633365.1 NAD(P)/FAD-dependent oxidoreductase [Paenibacillus radicis (ex Xue et al. 2023)]